MSKLLERHQHVILATDIIALGGRATTIESIVGIPKRAASKLHRDIANRSSKGGLLPWDPHWVVKTPMNCLHSSFFYRIYHDIEIRTPRKTEKKTLFLAAFRLYRNTIENHVIDIDRAWHIHLQYSSGNYVFKHCPRCKSNHLAHKNYPPVFQLCPLCDVNIDVINRKRWAQRP